VVISTKPDGQRCVPDHVVDEVDVEGGVACDLHRRAGPPCRCSDITHERVGLVAGDEVRVGDVETAMLEPVRVVSTVCTLGASAFPRLRVQDLVRRERALLTVP